MIRYGSVCSGVEAATVAWHPLGWQAQWFSEIEKFPSAVLAHHYSSVPNLGDMTKLQQNEVFNDRAIDLLVGGTPCQSFSVAGLRKGMADPRGNLALVYLALAFAKRPRWIVWENVPGVLSSNGGRDFGAFLGGLGQLGYGFAYRVLDAQYFGVAQRRRRVFVVGYLGDWRPAAEVLFEPHCMQGHPAPCRETGKGFATDVIPSLTASGRGISRTGETRGQDPVIAFGWQNSESQGSSLSSHVTPTLDKSKTPAVAIPNVMPTMRAGGTNGTKSHGARSGDTKDEYIIPVAHTLTARHDSSPDGSGRGLPLVTARMVAFGEYATNGTASTLKARDYKDATDLIGGMGVRRLTPLECERLQGFPDDYTLIKPNTPDGPRYKAMGNSMCVKVMAWIGQRIDAVDRRLHPV